MVTNQEILNLSLDRVEKIHSVIEKIYIENRQSFSGNRVLAKSFTSFFKITEKTIDRLKHPVLSIAMVGTTSAGKSTIVNSLVGRRIAPMEKKEMSAGILTLTDSTETSITVHPTPKAPWSSGTITDVTDEEIYDCIQRVFEKYQGRETKVAAPVIDVTGPIEWQRNPSILGLPNNLKVEFIDLPGLKTVNDRKNFEVIQKILSKAFCIVAMDFNDVDQSRIRRLLEEVKDVVKAANNNTEFLLFTLNKVDDVKSGEETANDKICLLKKSIKDTLSLPTEKEILPFVGRLYYLVQMAVIKDPNTFEVVGFKKDELKNIFKDCSNFFEQQYDDNLINEDEYDCIEHIKKALRKNNDIEISDVRFFHSICCRISEAKNLFVEVKRRINESFTHIVVRPTLDDFNKSLTKLLGDLDVYITINKNTSFLDLISDKIGILRSKMFIEGCYQAELRSKFNDEVSSIITIIQGIESSPMDDEMEFTISRIKKDLRKIREIISKGEKGFIDSEIDTINSHIDSIATNLSELKNSSDIISFLRSQSDNRVISVFNGITDIPATVRKNLTSTYLDEFRSFIAAKKSSGDFIENMSDKMPRAILDEFVKPYEMLSELFYQTFAGATKLETIYKLKSKTRKSENWKNLNTEIVAQSDRRVRSVLSKLTGLAFQRETNVLVGSIQQYLDMELDNILSILQEKARIQSGDIATLLKNALEVTKAELQLPEELFSFTKPGIGEDDINNPTGKVIVGYKQHSCRADEPIYETQYEKEYIYTCDNEVGCYNRWTAGIMSSEMIFWYIINCWLKDQISNYMAKIKETANEVTEMIDSFLEDRYKSFEAQQEDRVIKLEALGTNLEFVHNRHKELNTFNV